MKKLRFLFVVCAGLLGSQAFADPMTSEWSGSGHVSTPNTCAEITCVSAFFKDSPAHSSKTLVRLSAPITIHALGNDTGYKAGRQLQVRSFSSAVQSATAVPEPGSLLLAIAGLFLLAGFRQAAARRGDLTSSAEALYCGSEPR